MKWERRLLYIAFFVALVTEPITFLAYYRAEEYRISAVSTLTQCNKAVENLSEAYGVCHGKTAKPIAPPVHRQRRQAPAIDSSGAGA
jgi:hypothetical protein